MNPRVHALVEFYRHVQAERMQGVPILNPALSVEAVGFRACEPVEGEMPVSEGVLVTPWFMSLVRLPDGLQPHGGRVGRKFLRAFGNESFEFIGAHDVALGYHETCALFSPMEGFTSQAQAVETAAEVLAQLRPAPAIAPTATAPTEAVPARRAFLFGRRGLPGAVA